MIPYSRPKRSDLYTYARVNCLKTLPFTAAHTYIAHIWQYPPSPGVTRFNPYDGFLVQLDTLIKAGYTRTWTRFIAHVYERQIFSDEFCLICWCERINKFSLTNFHCSQQYNYTADEKKQTTGRHYTNLVPRVYSAFKMAGRRSSPPRHLESGVDPGNAITVSHHKNKIAVRPQFLNFLDQFSLSTRTDEQLLR